MDKTRMTLRLPQDLANDAGEVAQALGISLNAFIVLGVRNWVNYQRKQLDTGPQASMYRTVRQPTAAKRQQVEKVGPNQPCPCGSGQKYKRCHGKPGT